MSSATAFKLDKLDKNTVAEYNGKSLITIGFYGQGSSDKKRAADVNKVKKLSVKIQGKKNIIIKRPGKTWSKYGYYPQYPAKQLTLKGSIKGKKYTVTAYGNNGKKIKKLSGKIKSVYKGNPYY
ncbi:hypothetical protein [Methanobrevibacter arboriphilus]|nr:hypothetical protein [Methanobrevibacter arboriphilus]